jgi:phospholipid/cholesterol/gamma-HCH transport system substrate-binding protein
VKTFRDRNPYAVGIVSVLLIGALTGIAFGVGLLHLLEKTYKMEAVFTDAAGLRVGDDVKVAGVKVGRVTGIAVDRQHGQVEVDFVVNHGVEIHDGASAEIALETLLGAKFIRINDATAGDTNFEDMASDERVIPVERTKVPFDVFELTRIATEGIEELHTDQLNDFINQLADVTEGRRDSLTQLVTSIDDVSTAITSRDAQLDQLLERADALSQTLADKDQTLVELIDQSQAILDLIAQRRDDLATSLGEGADAVGQLASIISQHKAELDRMLSTLHPTLDTARAQLDDVNTALAYAGPGFYGQALAGSHGPWLNIYVRTLGPVSATVLCDVLGIPNCVP